MNEMQNFLFHLNKYVEYATEMRDAYERLSTEQQQLVIESSPTQESPETVSQKSYTWLENFNKKVE